MKKYISLLLLLAVCLMAGCGNKEPEVPVVGETAHAKGYLEKQLTASEDTLLWLNIIDGEQNISAQYVQLCSDSIPKVYGFDADNTFILMGDCCGEIYENCSNYMDITDTFLRNEIGVELNFDSIPCSGVNSDNLYYYYTELNGIGYGMCCDINDNLQYFLVNDNDRVISGRIEHTSEHGLDTSKAVLPEGGECVCGCD